MLDAIIRALNANNDITHELNEQKENDEYNKEIKDSSLIKSRNIKRLCIASTPIERRTKNFKEFMKIINSSRTSLEKKICQYDPYKTFAKTEREIKQYVKMEMKNLKTISRKKYILESVMVNY